MSNGTRSEAIQGNTIDLKYGVSPNEDMTNWTCRVVVKSAKSDVTPLIDINLTVLSGDTFYKTGLLDTSSLSVGDYWLMAQLDHAATSRSAEYHTQLKITEQGVF